MNCDIACEWSSSGSAVTARAAGDERETVVRGRTQHRFERCIAAEKIEKARATIRAEHRVQLTAARVAIDEHGAIAGLGERQREIRAHERLPIAGARTRDGEHRRAARLELIADRHANRAERLDHLRGFLGIRIAGARALDRGHGAEDRKSELPGDLLRVAQPRIRVIEQERETDRRSEAGDEREQQNRGRGVLRRRHRCHRRVENADVRDCPGLGQLRLLIPLLQHRIERRARHDVTLEPHQLDRARRNVLKLGGRTRHLMIQIAGARLQLRDQLREHLRAASACAASAPTRASPARCDARPCSSRAPRAAPPRAC